MIALIMKVPSLLIYLKDVGSPLIIMLTNHILPLMFGSWFLLGGLYDLLSQVIENLVNFQ
jgi:hypothetical protein